MVTINVNFKVQYFAGCYVFICIYLSVCLSVSVFARINVFINIGMVESGHLSPYLPSL